MEYHHPTSIDKILNEFLRQEGLETPLLQYRAQNCWNEVMGEAISRYTGEIYLRDNVLHVKIKSPALRNNLMLMHTDVARKINNYIGARIVKTVLFY